MAPPEREVSLRERTEDRGEAKERRRRKKRRRSRRVKREDDIRIVRGTPVDKLPSPEEALENAAYSREDAIRLVLERFPKGTMIDGRYEVGPVLAKGGMGCVFMGFQQRLERRVALKILLPQTHDPSFQQRFLLEASVSSRLNHRNIVTVHDFGETPSGEAYMVMEYLDGKPLSRLVATEGPLPLERALSIAGQIARALRSAHRAKVVHRDLKPSNVMIVADEEDANLDRAQVLDFGLVKVFEKDKTPYEEDPELTGSGMMLGSPRYMSPEQITCGPIDPRTDIYALGTILFEMVAGRAPFLGDAPSAILRAHLLEKPPSILALLPDRGLPPSLDTVIQTCLGKRPEDRYASMDEVIAAIEALSQGAPLPDGIASEARTMADFEEVDLELSDIVEATGPRVVPSWRRWGWAALVSVGLLGVTAGAAALPDQFAKRPDVQVILTSVPGGAMVSLRGEVLGRTPLRLTLPRRAPTASSVEFEFAAEGRVPVRLRGRLNDRTLELKARLPPAAPDSAGGAEP